MNNQIPQESSENLTNEQTRRDQEEKVESQLASLRWSVFLQEHWAAPYEHVAPQGGSAPNSYSFDALYNILKAAGCIKGAEQHCEFEDFMRWKLKKAAEVYVSPFEGVDLTPTMMTSATREKWQVLLVDGSKQLADKSEAKKSKIGGKKHLRRAKEKLRSMNKQLSEATGELHVDLARKCRELEEAILERRQEADAQGNPVVGAAVHSLNDSRLSCQMKPAEMFPKKSSIAEAVAALLAIVLPHPADSVLIIPDNKAAKDFCTTGAKQWAAQMLRSPLALNKKITPTEKLKLLTVFVIQIRIAPIAMAKIQSHTGCFLSNTIDAGAGKACKLQADRWNTESQINWAAVQAVVLRLLEPQRKHILQGNEADEVSGYEWRLGRRINTRRVVASEWARMRAVVLPKLHERAGEIERQLTEARAVSTERLAEVADVQFTEYHKWLFEQVAEHVGFIEQKQSGTKMQTKLYKENQRRLQAVRKALDNVQRAQESLRHPKKRDIETMQEVCPDQLRSVAQPAPKEAMQEIVKEVQRWTTNMHWKLKIDQPQDAIDAKYHRIYAAGMSGDYKTVKAHTFAPQPEMTLKVEQFAERSANVGKMFEGYSEATLQQRLKTYQKEEVPPALKELYEDAAAELALPFQRDHLQRVHRGRKRVEYTGASGIPTFVFRVLEDDTQQYRCTLYIELLFANAQLIHQKPYSLTQQFICFVIPKGGKRDFTLLKSWRDIMCGEAYRKNIGKWHLKALTKYIERTGQMGCVQLMAHKGYPIMAYAIKQLMTKIHMAFAFKLNIAVLLVDLDSFFYYNTTSKLVAAFVRIGLPPELVTHFTRESQDNYALLCMMGRLVKQHPSTANMELGAMLEAVNSHFQIPGGCVGCSYTLAGALVVSLALTNLIEKSGLGFVWPTEELAMMQDWDMPKAECPGTMSTDDMASVMGGGLSRIKRVPTDQVQEDALEAARIMAKFGEVGGHPFSMKSEARQLHWDANDQPHFPPQTLPLFTPEGMANLEVLPITETFRFLGVQADFGDRLKPLAEVDEAFELVQPHVTDDRLSGLLRAKMIQYTPIGKWRYLMDKVHESHAATQKRASSLDSDIKAALKLGKSCSAAALHARHEDFGMQLMDLTETQHQKRLSVLLGLANAPYPEVRAFFNLYASFEAKMCGVEVNDGIAAEFFHWEVEGVSPARLRRMAWKSDMALLCAELKIRRLRIARVSVWAESSNQDWKWALVPHLNSPLAHLRPATRPKEAKAMMQMFTDRNWADELKSLNSQGAMARVEGLEVNISNAWRRVSACPEKYWRWAVKAVYNLLPTAWHRHMYGQWQSPLCPACGVEVGNLHHILSKCPALSSAAYTWRHNQVLKIVALEIRRAGWHVISEGTDVPPELLPAEVVASIHHRRPDMIVMNAITTTHLKVVVVELQINFEREGSMVLARQGKIDRYAELMRAVDAAGQGRIVQASFVPIIVGARGAIMQCTRNELVPLQLADGIITKMLTSMSLEAIKGSHWLWSKWLARVYRHS